MKRDSGTVTVGYEEGLANQLPFMRPTLVGRVRHCKCRVSWFNSNWTFHLVAKPDKRAGSASKAAGIERCGVQVLWLSPLWRLYASETRKR